MAHALLAPSSSERWINCPKSALKNAAVPDTSSSYAQQGSDAHELGAYKIEKALGYKVRDPTPDLAYFDEEMAEHTDAYCEFIMEQVQTAKQTCADPLVLVEQKLDFSRWVKDSFGTADCIIVADSVLTVADFKYGLGVLVEAEGNPQMRMYALGALHLFEALYDIHTIRTIIFQPRRDNVSTAEISKNDLLILHYAETLRGQDVITEFSEDLWLKAIDHVTICKDGGMVFLFKDGTEIGV